MWPLALVAILALPCIVPASPPSSKDEIEREILAIRGEVDAIEMELADGALRRTSFTLGGGRNPAAFDVAYEAGTDADFERDPYAEPFRLRRIQIRRTLPAVGPASATFYYNASGQLRFVLTSGVDICGIHVPELRPADTLRAYFAGTLFRLIHKSEHERVVDVPLTAGAPMEQAVAVGRTLSKRAADLQRALHLLVALETELATP